jgi:hypothetical protein
LLDAAVKPGKLIDCDTRALGRAERRLRADLEVLLQRYRRSARPKRRRRR